MERMRHTNIICREEDVSKDFDFNLPNGASPYNREQFAQLQRCSVVPRVRVRERERERDARTR